MFLYYLNLIVCFRSSSEVLVDPVVSQEDMEVPSQPADKASLPSTSQEPTSSSAGVKHSHIFHHITL